MRRVRDELGAGAVEGGKPQPHALEGAGELTQLVGGGIDHGLVEASPGDPLCGRLETADATGEERCERVAEPDRECRREAAGDEHPPPDDLDRLEVVVQRGGEQHDRAAAGHRPGRLGEARTVARDGAADDPPPRRGTLDDRIVLDVARGAAVRVGDRFEQGRRAEDHDPGARRHRHGGVLHPGGAREDADFAPRLGQHAAERLAQVTDPRVDERVPVGRNHDQVDDHERAGHHHDQRKRQPSADRAERVHASRKR